MVFDTEEEVSKFSRIYDKYRKTIYYTVKHFVDNEVDIEDFLQDIYIIIGENLSEIDEAKEKKTQNYLITITRNYVISHWRKSKNRQEEEYSDEIDYSTTKYDPLRIIINEEYYAIVREALDKLDEKYRAVLELKYVSNLNDDTIAKILSIKKKNVQMRVYRAKQLMRIYVAEMEEHGQHATK